jgi:hypothetical protein
MGDQNKTQSKTQSQSQSGGQTKGTTQVGTHGNQGGGQGQGQTETNWTDRSSGEMYGEQGRQNQGQPDPQSQGNVGNTTKDPMGDQGYGANTRPTNQKR